MILWLLSTLNKLRFKCERPEIWFVKKTSEFLSLVVTTSKISPLVFKFSKAPNSGCENNQIFKPLELPFGCKISQPHRLFSALTIFGILALSSLKSAPDKNRQGIYLLFQLF